MPSLQSLIKWCSISLNVILQWQKWHETTRWIHSFSLCVINSDTKPSQRQSSKEHFTCNCPMVCFSASPEMRFWWDKKHLHTGHSSFLKKAWEMQEWQKKWWFGHCCGLLRTSRQRPQKKSLGISIWNSSDGNPAKNMLTLMFTDRLPSFIT